MRAFGPGSLSSLVKAVLDVAFLVLWGGAIVLGLALAAALLAQPFLTGPPHAASGPLLDTERLLRKGPMLLLVLALLEGQCALLILVIDRLRRIFGAMTRGDPFHPENVGRLRTAGAALAGLEALRYLFQLAAERVFSGQRAASPDVDVTGAFAILVVFVLAEVFREGARLRAEAELTV